MTDDRALAGELATAAGELLLDIRRNSGLSGRELGDAGDRQADDLILGRLAEERPDDAVLSEESADDKSRLGASRVWIVDPVDGTREYGTTDRTDWAVHVALWSATDGLIAGAVALPALGVTYLDDDTAVEPAEGLASRPRSGVPRVVVSSSRPPAFADEVAAAMGGEVLQMGSAGAKAMAVVRGEAEAYVHAGGQYEWDSAAPVAVAKAKGLWCGRIDGSPLVYNNEDTYLPDLIICRPEYTEAILTVTTEGAGG
ncbi:3'(2'),5'-bisphosphate nucleotidase CysQ [Gordonia sp. zg691]|uniref:3'(2'),5-bisphosphonucleoside 3'(2')-phosphohydrolase n=1 Tax=Gordonia jinghuaiqii TaxID=2758710 RepID=A0A7D7LZ24_9ACTN|nr:3'(2'),5'-bisphosphate nucleotidase CysQ [Gordonia jinghuaiqii]MBD0861797.1 3'(2'),5'-bisphosphate nucleotidase CysQ [Gordonia jinghuaiqii]MCR5977689.1 3'(2'),5'-bisphosphate nucleotidase CysQ [Gordonia jinghuaiqii]QMT02356.1 3'(2'),5'-bisphosphate nucleotidase CysQ [Gordonia jinghuaiqii]